MMQTKQKESPEKRELPQGEQVLCHDPKELEKKSQQRENRREESCFHVL
jgi:hypothetical protein